MILFALGMIGLSCIIFYIARSSKTKQEKLGRRGEQQIRRKLSKLDRESYSVLYDLLLPNGQGGTTQVDHIVLSKYGIFVIETKNFSGWIYGDEKNQQWTQVIYRKKNRFYNPILQNKSHIRSIEQLLQLPSQIPVVSVVVFTNKAELKDIQVHSKHTAVLSEQRLLSFIQSYSVPVTTFTEAEKWKNRLKESAIKGSKAVKNHVQGILVKQEQVEKDIASRTCPRCGGELVNRTGKHGDFLGCSSFPRCRFITKELAQTS